MYLYTMKIGLVFLHLTWWKNRVKNVKKIGKKIGKKRKKRKENFYSKEVPLKKSSPSISLHHSNHSMKA